MNPFTNYLPPHRPLCLCIGPDAPALGERNLRVEDIAGMLPLLRDTGAMFDLVSIVIEDLRPTSFFEQFFATGQPDGIEQLLNTFVTQRGNLVVFTRINLQMPVNIESKMWLKLRQWIYNDAYNWMLCLSHQHTDGAQDKPATDAWLTHRKGPVVDQMTSCTDSAERFRAADDEYDARRDPLHYEISERPKEDAGTIEFFVPLYHRYKRDIPNLHKHWMSLFPTRNIADIMRRPDDRATLRAIVASKQWRISPGALTAIQTAFATHAAASAPLNAQTEAQRLAWLDECGSVKTRDLSEQPHPLDAVFKADEYPITTTLLETRTPSQRPGSDGEAEEITHEGTALAARVIDDLGVEHTFTSNGVLDDTHHTWLDFLAIFHPPAVPDIAALRPEDYAARRHWLVQFAASLSKEPQA